MVAGLFKEIKKIFTGDILEENVQVIVVDARGYAEEVPSGGFAERSAKGGGGAHSGTARCFRVGGPLTSQSRAQERQACSSCVVH